MAKKPSIMMLLAVLYLKASLASPINLSFIDESSLLALKSNMDSNIFATWTQTTSFCSWIGVTCSRRHPRVTALKLSNMKIRGRIGEEIGNLSFLTLLELRNNSIRGRIPVEIGKLRRLRLLDAAFNQLIGRIPDALGLLTKMRVLSLSNNNLTGEIPRSLSACVELKIFSLSFNNLTGDFPSWLANLQLEQIFLWKNQLTGELPPTIFNISSLVTLHVGDNQISGSIPTNICNQGSNKLQELLLFVNQFEGEIPPTISRCNSLQVLSLADNKFTGNFPTALLNLSTIRKIGLGRNKFSGTIPPSIGNLSNLEVFEVRENTFHGSVPSEIGKLSKLYMLSLGLNSLNGELPQSIFNLSTLSIFSVQLNNLSGNLPFFIDKGLPNLQEMYLSANLFHGKFPASIANISGITRLDLATNMFSGYIPSNLGNLRKLQILNLAENRLQNNVSRPEQDFISSLAMCKDLLAISVSSNPISGALPESLGSGNMSSSLERFMAYNCSIVNPLPNKIGNLSRLFLLQLGRNEFTGPIPPTLGNFKSLQNLDISGNKFVGSIPEVLCRLNTLNFLDLSGNGLSGELPKCLGKLPLLREINLAKNSFNSSVPSALWLVKQVEKMNLSNNFFVGSLPGEIGNLYALLELDLSGNMFVGEIPRNLSQLQSITYLSLSNNKFNGSIFQSLADLKDLQHLDLSSNDLSGPIPKSLEVLLSLNYFNVSFNHLSGEIPDEGPFANFTGEFFAGNEGLCGERRFGVEECERNMPKKSSRKNELLKYVLAPIASVIVVATVILIFVLRRRSGKLLPVSLFELPVRVMHERISYREIVRATRNFNGENLVGRGSSGSVYRGNFSDEVVFAIKVFDLDVQDAMKSFDRECEIMRNVRHRNLVKTITSCSNLDFKALVMAYMHSGNLEKWLYSAECSLSIIRRLGIMVEVATAMEYLHEGYASPIVHCDLKPSNILLDEDMVAHVSDFGIAKLFTQEQRILRTKTLGTIGYIAPEYGSEGLVSTMVDVYSYGILLMEVFTRRRPTDEMFSGELTMRRWVSESFPDSVMQIVDHELLNVDDEGNRGKIESCLTSTIELALECSADLAEARPNMKDVLVRISKIKSNLSNRESEVARRRDQHA